MTAFEMELETFYLFLIRIKLEQDMRLNFQYHRNIEHDLKRNGPDHIRGFYGTHMLSAPETGRRQSGCCLQLAVVLYLLLFLNHPLEGKNTMVPCLTEELKRRFYGGDPIFVWDPHAIIPHRP